MFTEWESRRRIQIGFHTAVIGCETTSSRPNWRWRCYGNCWCCSHLWGPSQVKHLIKNFWCMPKLPLSSVRPYSYVFGAGGSAKAAVENGATSARLAARRKAPPPPGTVNIMGVSANKLLLKGAIVCSPRCFCGLAAVLCARRSERFSGLLLDMTEGSVPNQSRDGKYFISLQSDVKSRWTHSSVIHIKEYSTLISCWFFLFKWFKLDLVLVGFHFYFIPYLYII